MKRDHLLGFGAERDPSDPPWNDPLFRELRWSEAARSEDRMINHDGYAAYVEAKRANDAFERGNHETPEMVAEQKALAKKVAENRAAALPSLLRPPVTVTATPDSTKHPAYIEFERAIRDLAPRQVAPHPLAHLLDSLPQMHPATPPMRLGNLTGSTLLDEFEATANLRERIRVLGAAEVLSQACEQAQQLDPEG